MIAREGRMSNLISASTLDDWLRLYTQAAVRSMMVFFVVDTRTKIAQTPAFIVRDEFQASVAVKKMESQYPGQEVLVLGACRAIRSHNGNQLCIEATLCPELIEKRKSGEMDAEIFEYFMQLLKNYLEDKFPSHVGLEAA